MDMVNMGMVDMDMVEMDHLAGLFVKNPFSHYLGQMHYRNAKKKFFF